MYNSRIIRILDKYIKHINKKMSLTYINPSSHNNILNFARLFNNINILCQTKEQCNIVNEYKLNNYRIYEGDIMEHVNKLNHEIIIFELYDFNIDKDGFIYIQNVELVDIVNNLISASKIILIHLPKKYNVENFIRKFQLNDIDIYAQSNHSLGFYIGINLD